MKFSIITPTYKRSNKLTRAVESVLSQTYADWEMVIVNDSPEDNKYLFFENWITDPRVIYLKNKQNSGVNFSRNYALDNISKDSDWAIFLDDDDYFSIDALETFNKLIKENLSQEWFVTNRTLTDGKKITSFPKTNISYSYIWEYLLLKRCRGDVTHVISSKSIQNIRFPKLTTQGEEWLFFYRLGLKERMFYYDHNSTFTEGYDKKLGLNFRERTWREQFFTIRNLVIEGYGLQLMRHPTFFIYILIRLLRIAFKQ